MTIPNRPRSRGTVNRRGSVLVEALMVSSLLAIPCLGLSFELVRAAQLHVMVHHWCFMYVRYRALGISETESRSRISKFAEKALGSRSAARYARILDSTSERRLRGIVGRLHLRYPGFLKFLKDRIRISKKCLFYS
jgi:hypothetical protein